MKQTQQGWTDIGLDDAPDGAWLDGGMVDAPGLGQVLHLYAIKVETDEADGYRSAAADQLETELENLTALVGARPETVTIAGWPGEYVVYGLPFGD